MFFKIHDVNILYYITKPSRMLYISKVQCVAMCQATYTATYVKNI